MTAPALPPEVVNEVALLFAKRRQPAPTMDGAHNPNPAEIKAAQEAVEIIARALGGDGEPVAWGVFDCDRRIETHRGTEAEARNTAAAWNGCGAEGSPFTVAPLFTRPAATGDTGEVEKARAAFYEAAREAQEIAVEAASQMPLSGEEQAAVAEARKKRSDTYRALIKAERAATGGPDAR